MPSRCGCRLQSGGVKGRGCPSGARCVKCLLVTGEAGRNDVDNVVPAGVSRAARLNPIAPPLSTLHHCTRTHPAMALRLLTKSSSGNPSTTPSPAPPATPATALRPRRLAHHHHDRAQRNESACPAQKRSIASTWHDQPLSLIRLLLLCSAPCRTHEWPPWEPPTLAPVALIQLAATLSLFRGSPQDLDSNWCRRRIHVHTTNDLSSSPYLHTNTL